jgi:hypothetical protein
MVGKGHGQLGINLLQALIDAGREDTKESGEIILVGFRPIREELGQPISPNGQEAIDDPTTLQGQLELGSPSVGLVTGSTDQTQPLKVLGLARHRRSFDLEMLGQVGEPQARPLRVKRVEKSQTGTIDVNPGLGQQVPVKAGLLERLRERVQRNFDRSDSFGAFGAGRFDVRTLWWVSHDRELTAIYLP